MSHRGFSLIELLIALVVSALVCGAAAGTLVAARAAFEATPAAIDLQQRSRIALDLLAGTIRSAGSHVAATRDVGSLAATMPVVMPVARGGGRFSEIFVVSVVPNGSQGALERSQAGPGSAITLAAGPSCPQVSDVCGFLPGVVAAIADGWGRFDVFVVASTDVAQMSVTPSTALSAAYPSGAVVVEVDASRFSLALQPDGSQALMRQTQSGATQPIADGVSEAVFDVWGDGAAPTLRWDADSGFASYGPAPPPTTWSDAGGLWAAGESCAVFRDGVGPRSRLAWLGAAGTLVSLRPTELQDGPWCPGGPEAGGYDVDLFRQRRIDISLKLEVLSATLRGPAGRLFDRAGSAGHAPIRWVPDRVVTTSVWLRNRP